MFYKISLRSRLLLLISALVLINIAGSLVTVGYMYRTQTIYAAILDQDIKALLAAQNLETELVMQKGLATYFFLNHEEKWLDQLNQRQHNFQEWLKTARNVNHLEAGRIILNDIESRYIHFSIERDRVIELYKKGAEGKGAEMHWQVRSQFFDIYNLTGQFKKLHEKEIEDLQQKFSKSAKQMAWVAWAAIPCVLLISMLLTITLFRQILGPIHELAQGNDRANMNIGNEVTAIKNRMEDLLLNIDRTQAKLLESQEHLVQSEKMARVGKLAAGVAHSVRNPLTSVKMRLFTLERSLKMTPDQKEDLDVISEEIRHIDTILRNFLEYARPPKLKIQAFSPSVVVDMTLQLLRHRFDSYQTSVTVKRKVRLPEIPLDSDQMKEVLVNLLVNACEAMGEGGMIRIEEEMGRWGTLGEAAIIRIHDNGPGIAPAMIEKIFEPFFSSKEEGSGLGLSIAKRIIDEHDGEIHVQSKEGVGSTFTIALPIHEFNLERKQMEEMNG